MSCLWMHNNDHAHDLQNVNACLTPRCYRLHLEALGIRVLLHDSLVSLDGCCHLDGLEQRGSSSGGW